VGDGRGFDDPGDLEVGRVELAEQPGALAEQQRGHSTWSSSSSPARRYCWTTSAPPLTATGLPAAAAIAWSSADSMPSVTKVKVVPPCMTSGSRGWWVRTKTGWRKGGSSPHQPVQDSSHGPSPPPNILLPMMAAPVPPIDSSMIPASRLLPPPVRPWRSRQASSS
jgi:hypothetical protein